MISTTDIIVNTIGKESLYVLEKSGSAIFKENGIDTDFAISLLKNYKERLQLLEKEIIKNLLIDHSYLEYEFKTTYFAIYKLSHLISNIQSEDDALEASIYQSHLRKQDEYLRSAIEEELNI